MKLFALVTLFAATSALPPLPGRALNRALPLMKGVVYPNPEENVPDNSIETALEKEITSIPLPEPEVQQAIPSDVSPAFTCLTLPITAHTRPWSRLRKILSRKPSASAKRSRKAS